jgi:hypothetical protein
MVRYVIVFCSKGAMLLVRRVCHSAQVHDQKARKRTGHSHFPAFPSAINLSRSALDVCTTGTSCRLIVMFISGRNWLIPSSSR